MKHTANVWTTYYILLPKFRSASILHMTMQGQGLPFRSLTCTCKVNQGNSVHWSNSVNFEFNPVSRSVADTFFNVPSRKQDWIWIYGITQCTELPWFTYLIHYPCAVCGRVMRLGASVYMCANRLKHACLCLTAQISKPKHSLLLAHCIYRPVKTFLGFIQSLLKRLIHGFLIPEGPSKSNLRHCGWIIAQPPVLIVVIRTWRIRVCVH